LTERAKLIALDDLKEMTPVSVDLPRDRGAPLVRAILIRVSGEPMAFVNRCPHLSASLDLRTGVFLDPTGSVLVCKSHGAMFEPATGLCVSGPCEGQSLKRIAIELDAEHVYLAQ
jgi:nitrite reductase/ring-hydroxylating ferredoxin subunit